MKLKMKQLFYLVNKLTKPFDVPNLVRDEKNKERYRYHIFSPDKHTDITENFRSGTSVYK